MPYFVQHGNSSFFLVTEMMHAHCFLDNSGNRDENRSRALSSQQPHLTHALILSVEDLVTPQLWGPVLAGLVSCEPQCPTRRGMGGLLSIHLFIGHSPITYLSIPFIHPPFHHHSPTHPSILLPVYLSTFLSIYPFSPFYPNIHPFLLLPTVVMLMTENSTCLLW